MHNDRRRKRSQRNTAAATAASSRPARSGGGALGAAAGDAAGGGHRASPQNSPPLPSVRTASGFGLMRPAPAASYGGGGPLSSARLVLGGGGYMCAVAGGGNHFGDLESARRASEPAGDLGRVAAGFLSEASSLLGRPSSRAAAMYGNAYDTPYGWPVGGGGFQPASLQHGGGMPHGNSGGLQQGSYGSGFSSPSFGGSLHSGSLHSGGGLQHGGGGGGALGGAHSPFTDMRSSALAGGFGNGFGGDDGCDSPTSLGSVRTPSGRALNLKRRGSVNAEMRNLNLHMPGVRACQRHLEDR